MSFCLLHMIAQRALYAQYLASECAVMKKIRIPCIFGTDTWNVNPSSAETGIFRNQDNTMTADDLPPYITRPSATMVFNHTRETGFWHSQGRI